MADIYKYNGIIYLRNFSKEFDWVTYPVNSDPYFILNNWTRLKFKEDILPLLKSNVAYIPKPLYDEIRYYRANPIKTTIPTMETLQGITYKNHQVTAIQRMLSRNRFGFFLGPGSGKTIIALGFLKTIKPSSALIVTPQKVVAQYQSELIHHLGPDTGYIVTNYEQLHKYLNQSFECLILDESHKAKNYSSNINKNCRELAQKAEYVYLFTGTPQDKSRHEILAQIAILDTRVMPVKTKTLHRYFNIDDFYNPSTEKKTFSDELTSVINTYTWGKPTEEVVQLTKEHNYLITCDKPPLYDKLTKDRVYKHSDDWRCVADNKGVLKVKLRELCSGHLILDNYTGDKALTYKDNFSRPLSDSKTAQLANVIFAKVERGIIYYEYDANLESITTTIDSIIGSTYTYEIINGKTNKKQVKDIIEKFKNNEFNFLIMQNKSGNAGLDLTNVNNIIFYSLPDSHIVFSQCKARINRIGQTKECNYWYLLCKDTVEEQIYEALKKKKNFTTRLFKIYS